MIKQTFDNQKRKKVLMKQLSILWRRLVNSQGDTCDRCNATYQEIKHSVEKLKQCLRPLGIDPILKIEPIDEKSFKANPSESNRIWIAEKPIEEWLSASIGSSPCCSVCGKTECRTIQISGNNFEVIPEKIIISAALVATSHLLITGNDQ